MPKIGLGMITATLRAILIAATALTIAAPSLPALASAGHGLKKVYDPGRVTGTIRQGQG